MSFYRQLLVFTVPSVAVLFGIYWYRRRRGFGNCDPGGNIKNLKSLHQELEEALATAASESRLKENVSSPTRVFHKSAPIDIVPNSYNSQRSSPLELTEQQIDQEVERVIAQKQMEEPVLRNSRESTPPALTKRPKSLPTKGMQTPEKSPENVTKPKISHSVKDSPMSCLTEQLLNCKLSEVAATGAVKTPVKPSITSIKEEPKVESSTQSLDCNNTSNEKQTETVSTFTECISSTTTASECATTQEVNEDCEKSAEKVANVTKCDKPVKSKKSNKKQNSITDKKSTAIAEKKNTNASDKKQFTGTDKTNKLEVVKKDTSLEILSQQDRHSIANSEKENHHLSMSSEIDVAQNRDSANHSPFDTMLASPSNGHFSDNHSEGSNDSGKGCSESPSPPPTNISSSSNPSSEILYHQFIVPVTATGILIGTRKSFLAKLNTATRAKVSIREHFESAKHNICCIEGTQQDINIVLGMIKQRFPEKKFPNISLRDMSAELLKSEFSLLADCYYLNLVEGVNNDVIISCYVSPSQLFLQQPMHPSYPSLHILHQLMGASYQDPNVPKLPSPVKEGMICAAPTANNWYRTRVMTTNNENDTSLVKLVDFGGFMDISNSLLKQIHGDFMMLPFQAIEVQLAHIAPVEGEEWTPEAVQIVAGLTSGQLLQAQISGYNEDGLPQVYLYLTLGPQQVISLNQELVVRGLAQWVEQES